MLQDEHASAEPAVQLHLLLKHNKDETLPHVAKALRSDAATSDTARTKIMSVVAEV
jgi:hypothetical protein